MLSQLLPSITHTQNNIIGRSLQKYKDKCSFPCLEMSNDLASDYSLINTLISTLGQLRTADWLTWVTWSSGCSFSAWRQKGKGKNLTEIFCEIKTVFSPTPGTITLWPLSTFNVNHNHHTKHPLTHNYKLLLLWKQLLIHHIDSHLASH